MSSFALHHPQTFEEKIQYCRSHIREPFEAMRDAVVEEIISQVSSAPNAFPMRLAQVVTCMKATRNLSLNNMRHALRERERRNLEIMNQGFREDPEAYWAHIAGSNWLERAVDALSILYYASEKSFRERDVELLIAAHRRVVADA